MPVISAAPLMTLLLMVNTGCREPAEVLAPPCRPTPPNVGPSPGAGEVATECSPHLLTSLAAAELLAPACKAAVERLPTVESDPPPAAPVAGSVASEHGLVLWPKLV
jgi:hypothetical protein